MRKCKKVQKKFGMRVFEVLTAVPLFWYFDDGSYITPISIWEPNIFYSIFGSIY